jgi:hypothetical protein
VHQTKSCPLPTRSGFHHRLDAQLYESEKIGTAKEKETENNNTETQA